MEKLMKRLYREADLDHVAAQLLVKAQTKPQHVAEELQVVAAELAERASRLRTQVIRRPLPHKS